MLLLAPGMTNMIPHPSHQPVLVLFCVGHGGESLVPQCTLASQKNASPHIQHTCKLLHEFQGPLWLDPSVKSEGKINKATTDCVIYRQNLESESQQGSIVISKTSDLSEALWPQAFVMSDAGSYRW